MTPNNAIRSDFERRALPELPNLYRTARYMVGDESRAQDLVLEAFARAYRSWHNCQSSMNCRVWLFRILVNIHFCRYRHEPRKPAAMQYTDEREQYSGVLQWSVQVPANRIGQLQLDAITGDDVQGAIQRLPDESRLILVLCLLEEFSYREIAEITNLDVDTVRFRLRHARLLIRRHLRSRDRVPVAARVRRGRMN